MSQNSGEEFIKIKKSELEELVTQKVEQKLQNKKSSQEKRSTDTEEKTISRRSFLKKLGAGAIGLGALTLPVSGMVRITGENIYKDGTEYTNDILTQTPDIKIEDLETGATSGTVPTAQSDGTVQMEPAGIGSDGDFLALDTQGNISTQTINTSSTTYGGDENSHKHSIVWNNIVPSGEQSAVWSYAETTEIPSTETVDIRLQNVTDNETIFEQTGITSVKEFTFGPKNYTPATMDSVIHLQWQIRTDPGDNWSRVGYVQTTIGIIL